MKKLIALSVMSVMAASSAFAQGTLNFANFFGSFRQPVYDIDGATLLDGARYQAELWYNDGSDFVLLDGSQTPFGSGAILAGYFLGGSKEIPAPTGSAGGSVQVMVHAFDTMSANEGWSDEFTVSPLGGGALPAANMQNFTSFSLVPEPSIFALAILGAGALFLRRRRNK